MPQRAPSGTPRDSAWAAATKFASIGADRGISGAGTADRARRTGGSRRTRTRHCSAVVARPSQGRPRRTAGRREQPESTVTAVYFQACVGTMFGPSEGGMGVAVAFESLAAKAGIGLLRPDGDRRPLLRNPVEVEGHPRRLRRHGHAHDVGPLGGIRRRHAAGRLRQLVVLGGPRALAREGGRRASRVRLDAHCSTRSTSRPSTSCRGSSSTSPSTPSSCTPPARAPAADRTPTSLELAAAIAVRGRRCLTTGVAAPSQETGGCCIRS